MSMSTLSLIVITFSACAICCGTGPGRSYFTALIVCSLRASRSLLLNWLEACHLWTQGKGLSSTRAIPDFLHVSHIFTSKGQILYSRCGDYNTAITLLVSRRFTAKVRVKDFLPNRSEKPAWSAGVIFGNFARANLTNKSDTLYRCQLALHPEKRSGGRFNSRRKGFVPRTRSFGFTYEPWSLAKEASSRTDTVASHPKRWLADPTRIFPVGGAPSRTGEASSRQEEVLPSPTRLLPGRERHLPEPDRLLPDQKKASCGTGEASSKSESLLSRAGEATRPEAEASSRIPV